MPGLVTAFRREEKKDRAAMETRFDDRYERGYYLGRAHAWSEARARVQQKNKRSRRKQKP